MPSHAGHDLLPKTARRKTGLLKYRLLALLSVLGPGFITVNVDNDPGGILTYSQAGAKYGYALLWTLTRFYSTTVSPKYISALVLCGVLVSLALSAYFHIFTAPRFVGQIMGLAGSIVFLRLAWMRKMPWGAIFRSAEFWTAFVVALAGNIVGSIFSGT